MLTLGFLVNKGLKKPVTGLWAGGSRTKFLASRCQTGCICNPSFISTLCGLTPYGQQVHSGAPVGAAAGGCSEECSGPCLPSWGPLGLRAWPGLPDNLP